jgi:hypothetical protein
MFGHASLPSRIYTFDSKPPGANAELVDDQMRRGHRYRNDLVAAERGRRDRIAEAVVRHCPELAAVEAELAAADARIEAELAAISKRNTAERRRTATAEDRARLAALRAERRETYRRRREVRATGYALPAFVAEQTRIEAEHGTSLKALRVASGLYWGNYLVVEQGLQSIRSGPPPKFHRFDGGGRIAVQIQKGLAWTDALIGADKRVRVEILPEPVGPQYNKRGVELPAAVRPKTRARVWLRVSSEGRNPVWTTVDVVLHRQPPGDAQIKWIYLRRTRVGTHAHWQVQFVLSRAAGWAVGDEATDGAVGVEVGWRRTPQGLRVAVWRGSDGAGGELVLPDAEIGRWARSDSLRATRDKSFNVVRDNLVAWLRTNAVPAWLTEATATLAQWRSTFRLAALVIRWRAERFPGDEEAFAPLEAWRAQDKHLLEWEANGREKAIRWRDDFYRRFAADLRRRYQRLAVEAIDWGDLARVPGPEAASAQAAIRQWRFVAAAGRLVQLLTEKAPVVVRRDPAGTTMDCHACGHANTRLDNAERYHACAGCGAEWDVDENAALWLLDAAGGQPVAAGPQTARDAEDEADADGTPQ